MELYPAFKRGRVALPFVVALLALAGGVGYVRAEVRAVATVRVTDAWVRSTPPGSTVGAAYATLHNESAQALLISSVSSDVSRSAELHEMSMRDGVMRMRHLDSGLSLKAGETVKLAPGGMHLMLFGLQQPLRAGDTVLLHFRISDGHEISVAAPVRETAP